MKYLFFIVIILFSSAGHSYIGDLLYIKSIRHQMPEGVEFPSCLILKHRSLEFEKFTREIKEVSKEIERQLVEGESEFIDYTEAIESIEQKLFADPSTFGHRQINTILDIEISKDFKQAINEVGINDVVMSFDFFGFTISEKIKYLKKFYGFKINYLKSKGVVRVQYKISRFYMCQYFAKEPVASWLLDYENFSTRTLFYSFRRDKIEAFNKARYLNLFKQRLNSMLGIRDFLSKQSDQLSAEDVINSKEFQNSEINSYFTKELFRDMYENSTQFLFEEELEAEEVL